MNKADQWLTIALAKGRMLPSTLELLEAAGIGCGRLREKTRRLLFTEEESGLRFLLAKPADIPTYVEFGVADLGIVGKDVLLEQERRVYELLDLQTGYCRLVLAQKAGSSPFNGGFVATKFPRTAERYLQGLGKQFEIIKLHGSVELAPLLGLSDVIVDLVSTGRTLRENQLEEVATIAEITARLIANPGSYQTKGAAVLSLVDRLEKAVKKREGKNAEDL